MVFLGLWLPFRNISRCFFIFYILGHFRLLRPLTHCQNPDFVHYGNTFARTSWGDCWLDYMVFLGLWLPFRNISRCFFHFLHIGPFSPFKAPDTLPKSWFWALWAYFRTDLLRRWLVGFWCFWVNDFLLGISPGVFFFIFLIEGHFRLLLIRPLTLAPILFQHWS